MDLREKLEKMVEGCAQGIRLDHDEALAVCYFAFMVVNAQRTAGNDELFRRFVDNHQTQMANDLAEE
jgi:hypothetical protein